MTRREFLKWGALAPAAIGVTLASKQFLAIGGIPVKPSLPPEVLEKAPWLDEQMAVGDVFTVAGIYAVNPATSQETEHLQQFVVTSTHPASVHLRPRTLVHGVWQLEA